MDECQNYLAETIGPIIQKILKEDVDFELDDT
jgi:hypothetical protein